MKATNSEIRRHSTKFGFVNLEFIIILSKTPDFWWQQNYTYVEVNFKALIHYFLPHAITLLLLLYYYYLYLNANQYLFFILN